MTKSLYKQWQKERHTEKLLRNAQGRIKEERENMPGCKHKGFVVRDIQGVNRFLCKECDERFPRHPWGKKTLVVTDLDPVKVMTVMESFREGIITLATTMRKLQFTIEEFTIATTNLFPPRKTPIREVAHEIGSPKARIVVTGEYDEPQRTSTPQEVEDVFHDQNTNLDALTINALVNRFPDLKSMESIDEQICQRMVYKLKFIDDTIQRVEVPHSEFILRRGIK